MASTGPSLFPGQAVTTSFSGLYPGSTDYPGFTDYTGDVITPTATLYPSITNYPGQGLLPIARCRLSFDDVSVSSPSWSEVLNSKLRAFSVSHGRDSEQQNFDAGSATVTLDNRDRAYDPTVNASIRPMNRVWLYEEFTGEVHDLFRGYVEVWDQQWPGFSDAQAVIQAVDEFKVLNQLALPVLDPPQSNTYADVVQFDNPAGYWQWTQFVPMTTVSVTQPTLLNPDDPGSEVLETSVTVSIPGWKVPNGGGYAVANTTAIVGDAFGSTEDGSGGSLFLQSGAALVSTDAAAGDMLGSSLGTIEFWFQKAGNPGVATAFWGGPQSTAYPGFLMWIAYVAAAGNLQFSYLDSTGVQHVATTALPLDNNTWYHVVFRLDGTNQQIYLNGVLAATQAMGTFFASTPDPANPMILQYPGATVSLDEMAVYPGKALSTARINAHYTAGVSRGFAKNQLPHERVGSVLDTITSRAPRSLRTCARALQGRFMTGQPPLQEINTAVQNEKPDGAFFVRADGTVVLLDAAHRSSSPYNTVQAVFGDAGEIPYTDLNVDYSESFLSNEYNVSREGPGGTLQSASDATSISRYMKRSQSFTTVPLTVNADAAAMAAAYLAKYKDPMLRVTELRFDTGIPASAEAVFRRELMDRITVKRTPPGGGARISQDLFIQKIEVNGTNDGTPWGVRWAVSPV